MTSNTINQSKYLDTKLGKIADKFIELYGRKPKDIEELESFTDIIDDVALTYGIDISQVDLELVERYMKLFN